MVYSASLRARMVQRMTSEGISPTSLAMEVGIPRPTLSRWRSKATQARSMTDSSKRDDDLEKSTRDWTPEEKLSVVIEASSLTDEELGAFLRSKGLLTRHLVEWRKALLGALLPDSPAKARGDSRQAKRILSAARP